MPPDRPLVPVKVGVKAIARGVEKKVENEKKLEGLAPSRSRPGAGRPGAASQIGIRKKKNGRRRWMRVERRLAG